MVSTTAGRSLKTAKAVLVVLKQMALTEEGLTTEQVAELTGKSSATATYLLNSLVVEGFAHRVSNGLYRLADPAVLTSDPSQRSPTEELVAGAQELYGRTRERAYIGLPYEDSVVIHDTWGRQGQPMLPGVGPKVGGAAHALAVGKAVLAHMGPERVAAYIDRYGLTRFTPATITDPDVLAAELAEVVTSGVAVSNEEFTEGFSSIAAPVFDAKSHLLGVVAISISQAKLLDHGARLILVLKQIAKQASDRAAEVLELQSR